MSAPQLFHAEPIRFTVIGTPRPQGSMRAFWRPGMQRPAITSDNKKLRPWRQEIAGEAQALNLQPFPQHVPVEIVLRFYFTRPPSASEKKRPAMTVKPDLDKLQRAVLDALKGILLHDDSQVIELYGRKCYGGPERVEIELREAIA